jgi:DhnA family fructose-bisphosphate aldolase class Ia
VDAAQPRERERRPSKIAQEQLSAICHATGVLKLTNSALLHNKPMLVKLSIKQSTGYEPQNDIEGVQAARRAPMPANAGGNAAAAAAAPATASAANAPAWAQKKSA